jgi:D-glycerate 3-kinase
MDKHGFRHLIGEQMAELVLSEPRRPRPVVVGLSAPQGAGKTTLCTEVCRWLGNRGLVAVPVSIDDFYLTRAEQLALAARHAGNRYFAQRGLPGTHDIALGTSIVRALRDLGTAILSIPTYDKGALAGKGDRKPNGEWRVAAGPIDLVILEGWMLGFTPVPEATIGDPEFVPVNRYLEAYQSWTDELDALIWLEPDDYRHVRKWRAEAERKAIASGRDGMTPEEVEEFVELFLPAYEVYGPGLRSRSPVHGPLLHWRIGADRLPLGP